MIRLALLPPAAPTRWWRALAEGLASRGVDVLWVSDEPASDPRVGWLPISAGAATGGTVGAADRASATGGNGGNGGNCGNGGNGAALLVDVRAPRADVVAAMAGELPVLTVADGPLDAATEALARHGRRLLVPSAALARTLPPDLPTAIVPGLLDALDLTETADRSLDGAPTVAVLGAPLTDHVRLAWAPITQRWPDAVLVGDVDALAPEARVTLLQDAHVVVVLDAGGSALGEALAAGATVIAHADPEASAVLTHGVNGLLTDARAPQQLAGTLAYALGYHEQLAPLRRAGRVLARERFSTATLAERVLEQLHASDGAMATTSPAGTGPAPTDAHPEAFAPVAAGPAEVTATRSAI